MLTENIRKLRKIRHLSQIELANDLGVSKQCISNWENDNILPSVDMLVKIAKFFNISTDAFLGIEDIKTVSVDGLDEVQIDHIQLLISDLRSANAAKF